MSVELLILIITRALGGRLLVHRQTRHQRRLGGQLGSPVGINNLLQAGCNVCMVWRPAAVSVNASVFHLREDIRIRCTGQVKCPVVEWLRHPALLGLLKPTRVEMGNLLGIFCRLAWPHPFENITRSYLCTR